MANPFIQIGDEYREMTDEEYADYKKVTESVVALPNDIQPIGA